MNKYVIIFSKEGYIKYTSHLDMLRLFKRAFKKTEIRLEYSQGFNPHPKMGFAQPLSLGYTSEGELLEIETRDDFSPEDILERLGSVMPEGIKIVDCRRLKENKKTIAAEIDSAVYTISFPVKRDSKDFNGLVLDYLKQDEIIALKRQKKTKKMAPVDIKAKIRSLSVLPSEDLTLELLADCGSESNLSPEQVIASFISFANLDVMRYNVEVCRKKMNLGNNLQI